MSIFSDKRRTGDIDEIREKLETRLKDKKEAEAQLETSKQFVKRMQASMPHREAHWTALRNSITATAKTLFSETIAKRGYSGSIELDHEAGGITLNVYFGI
jgi:hypothetical protein